MEADPRPAGAAAPDPFGGGRVAARALLASLAFRVRHAWHDAPPSFDRFAPGAGVRTPSELLGHVTSLLRFAATALTDRADPDGDRHGEVRHGEEETHARTDVASAGHGDGAAGRAERLAAFDVACRALDRALRDGTPAAGALDPEAMLRGPLADALTHAGQLTLLRRLAGRPVAAVSYWRVPMPAPDEDG